MVKYPSVRVKLVGMDGNVFGVIGAVSRALRKAEVPQAEINTFSRECFAKKSYDELLQYIQETVEVE